LGRIEHSFRREQALNGSTLGRDQQLGVSHSRWSIKNSENFVEEQMYIKKGRGVFDKEMADSDDDVVVVSDSDDNDSHSNNKLEL
jgi:hypothetical protein